MGTADLPIGEGPGSPARYAAVRRKIICSSCPVERHSLTVHPDASEGGVMASNRVRILLESVPIGTSRETMPAWIRESSARGIPEVLVPQSR
jgi:hypothetical protein